MLVGQSNSDLKSLRATVELPLAETKRTNIASNYYNL
jgi:hypothetical protein